MPKPLISIIVRTKNESYWIGKCLHAISKQNYENIETILVDNSSKDNTVQIVKKNFPKVRIINYKGKKFFPGRAINLGIKKSKGNTSSSFFAPFHPFHPFPSLNYTPCTTPRKEYNKKETKKETTKVSLLRYENLFR